MSVESRIADPNDASSPVRFDLLIADLAEPALRDSDLFVEQTPFFERYDRLLDRKSELALECRPFLEKLSGETAIRVAHTYAFADLLLRDVLKSFCPHVSDEAEHAHRLLAAAAVLVDQLLDERQVPLESLAPVRGWIERQAKSRKFAPDDAPSVSGAGLEVLVLILRDFFARCEQRVSSGEECEGLCADLLLIFDAELSSLGVGLQSEPNDRVRRIVYDKSVLLFWVCSRPCFLGRSPGSTEFDDYRALCIAVGEIVWILDDLVDLAEDRDDGVWNRTLWILYDRVGETRFRKALPSNAALAEMVRTEGVVEQAVSEVAERIEFVATHPRTRDASRLRSTLAFLATLTLRIHG